MVLNLGECSVSHPVPFSLSLVSYLKVVLGLHRIFLWGDLKRHKELMFWHLKKSAPVSPYVIKYL